MIVSAWRHRALPYSLAAFALALAVFAAQAETASAALPTAGGIYKGHVKGGNARLTVAPDARTLDLEISYKEICRFGDDRPFRSRTGVSVRARINSSGRFRKSQQLDGPHVRYSGRFRRGGRRVVGRFRASLTTVSGEHCRARVPFRLRRVDIGRALQPSDAGSYVGRTEHGQPVSFTLDYQPEPPGGTFTLRNFAITGTLACYLTSDIDSHRNIVVHLGGLSGKVPYTGDIYQLETPIDAPYWINLENVTIRGGSAKGTVSFGALHVDADGNPSDDGEYTCTRVVGGGTYGQTFTATRR